MASRDDLALLQQTMPTGTEGVKALEKFMREGNAEVRKLLHDECDVLLECRYCRNIFRSVINFVSHKRAFCRASYVAVVMANGAVDDEGRTETATKKRVGQMSALTKRLETNMVPIGDTQEMMALYTLPRIMKELPTTTFADGIQKVIGSLPSNLAQKEALPEDRVCVTMPQDNSSRYKEMSLRSRKTQNADKLQHREFTNAEIKIIENFEKQDVRCGDFVLLQCDHPSCAGVRPFHSLQALAYHCSLRHTKAFSTDGGDERWPCLLCCRHMWSLDGVNTHLMRVHPNVKEDHLRKRQEEDKAAKRPGKSTGGPRRARSLSIDPNAAKTDDEEEEDDQEEEMIIEEEEGRGRRRARGGGSNGGKAPVPQLQQPTPDRTSRGPSDNSDDYGDPPVLHPAEECGMEEEADEEDYDDAPPPKPKKQKKSLTPESDAGEKREDEEEEEEEEPKYDSVEGCLEALLDGVCESLGEEVPARMRRTRSGKKSVSAERHSRSLSAKPKRGRPKKSELEERKDSHKAGRPPKKSVEPKPKRQYIRKKDRESMEASQKERERDTASSEHSQEALQPSSSQAAAAAADAARPLRHRKRPRWMMFDGDDEMAEEGAAAKKKEGDADHSIVDESEEEEAPAKDELKRKRAVASTPLKKDKKESSQEYSHSQKKELTSGKIGEEMRSEATDIMLFTPRAGKFVKEKMRAEAASSSSHKRKQNLGKLADESEDIMIVSVNDPMNGPKKSDLTSVPVYLSEHQQMIFFSGLVLQKSPENDAKKDHFECMYCHMKLPNIRDGRRHMVAHLRVMRLRCGLCGAGAFFCIDMRNHLQLRGCPELNKAPKHMVRNGIPCMTKESADELTFVAHSGSPGRALFTSGKIVSILSNSPYLPDPVIEEKILGPTRVPPRHVSPRKQAHKLTMAASVLKEAEKGTVSLAAAQRSSSTSAAAAVLPIEDAGVHYYEDTMDPEAAADAASAAAAPAAAESTKRTAAASTSSTSSSMPPPDPKKSGCATPTLRAIGEPLNAKEARAACLPAAVVALEAASASAARRALIFPSEEPSPSSSFSTSTASEASPARERGAEGGGVGVGMANGHRALFGQQAPPRVQSVGARSNDSYDSAN